MTCAAQQTNGKKCNQQSSSERKWRKKSIQVSLGEKFLLGRVKELEKSNLIKFIQHAFLNCKKKLNLKRKDSHSWDSLFLISEWENMVPKCWSIAILSPNFSSRVGGKVFKWQGNAICFMIFYAFHFTRQRLLLMPMPILH